MCKAISQSLQTKIYVSVAPNGTVRFEFVGQRIKRAQEYIMGEFCKVFYHYYYTNPLAKYTVAEKDTAAVAFSSYRIAAAWNGLLCRPSIEIAAAKV